MSSLDFSFSLEPIIEQMEKDIRAGKNFNMENYVPAIVASKLSNVYETVKSYIATEEEEEHKEHECTCRCSEDLSPDKQKDVAREDFVWAFLNYLYYTLGVIEAKAAISDFDLVQEMSCILERNEKDIKDSIHWIFNNYLLNKIANRPKREKVKVVDVSDDVILRRFLSSLGL